jgi:hypothetical protein
MYADSTKLAGSLEGRIAALKGLVEAGTDIGHSQRRAMAGGLAYRDSQLEDPGACTDTKALVVEKEICTEDSGWGT